MALSLQQASVLVIDDFQGMRTMLRDFVRSMGISKTDTASNARDAVAKLTATRYDIVICDYNLGPGPNGQQVLEEARVKNLIGMATIWVMVTAEKTPEMVMGAAEVRPDDYLLKPINQVVLQARLNRLIARKQALAPIEAAVKNLRYTEAIALCDVQLKARPSHPQEILRVKSELMMTVGDHAGATALFDAILARQDVPWALTGLGKIHYQSRQFAKARDIFSQVLQEHKAFMEASDWLAKTCTRMGETQEAQQVLQDAIRISPNSPVRQQTLGEVAFQNGALDVAQGAFEKTIRLAEFSPYKSPSAYTWLARVLAARQEPEGALRTLALGRHEFRHDNEAALQSGAVESAIYHQMGQTERAREVMDQTERLLQQNGAACSAETGMALARSLFALGRTERGLDLLRDVVRNHHDDPEVVEKVQQLFAELNLRAEGQALIAQCCQEVVAINNQGVTLARDGDLQGGIDLLRSAATKLPGNEVILVNLCGLLLALLGKTGQDLRLAGEARELLERLRQINLGNRHYHSYSAALNRITAGW